MPIDQVDAIVIGNAILSTMTLISLDAAMVIDVFLL